MLVWRRMGLKLVLMGLKLLSLLSKYNDGFVGYGLMIW